MRAHDYPNHGANAEPQLNIQLECRVARPQCVRSVRGQGHALTPLPSGSKGVPVWDFSSHPPSQLELEHFRHLSVESIVHTHTSVGLVPGHAVCFLSSMLISTTVHRGGPDS